MAIDAMEQMDLFLTGHEDLMNVASPFLCLYHHYFRVVTVPGKYNTIVQTLSKV